MRMGLTYIRWYSKDLWSEKRSLSYLLLNSWKISRSCRYGSSCGRHPISGYLAIFLGFHILDIWWPVPWMATNPRLGTWLNPDVSEKLYSKEIFSSHMQSSSSSTTYPSKSMRSIKDYLCQDTIHPSNTNRAWRWISSWKYISISVKNRLLDLVSC